jgi:hypothetical protein
MKQLMLIISTSILGLLFACNNQNTQKQISKEKTIKEYFSGWEKKDWNLIAKNLAGEFTFTSPNNDDHISIEKFKEKCWVQATYIQKFDFIRITENETGAYVTYQLFTNNNTSFRNTEYFDFDNGKIKAIEVFFGIGQGSQGFPSNEK